MRQLNYSWRSLVGISVLSGLLACNADEPIPSTVSLLTAHTWQLSTWTSTPALPATINGTATPFTNLFDLYRAINNTCPLDQHFTFAAGPASQSYEYGNYSYRQGQAASCGSQQRSHSGLWSRSDSNGKILLYLKAAGSGNVYNDIYTVSELSSTRLVLTDRAQIVGSPTIYTRTYTFTAE